MLQTATPRAKAVQVFSIFQQDRRPPVVLRRRRNDSVFSDGIEQVTAQAGRIRYGYECHGIDVRPCLKLYHGGHVGDGIFQIGVNSMISDLERSNNNLHRHNRWRALP
jgi:hypothetical protein